MPLNIRIQWNAGTACVSECVLKTLACRGLRVGPSKFPGSSGNFRGSLGNFWGTSGLLLKSKTVGEVPGKSPRKEGPFSTMARKQPIRLNGAFFPSLMGRFPTLTARFPACLNGPFPARKSPGKQPIKKRGIKWFLRFEMTISKFERLTLEQSRTERANSDVLGTKSPKSTTDVQKPAMKRPTELSLKFC